MADDNLGFEIQGLEAVIAKFKTLENETRRNTTRTALRRAANVIRDQAQVNAARLDNPATSQNISENIVVRLEKKRYRKEGEIKMRVGVVGGSKKEATFYWRFLEFGTEKMKATPFMRPAMDESIQPATTEFVKQFDKAIGRAIKRAKKAKRGK